METIAEQTQRNTEAIAQLAEQTQRNTEAIAQLAEQTQRNTEAIAVLTEQVQRLTEAVERHEAILTRHGELIEEDRKAIQSLRESMEQMRQHFTERIDALQEAMEQMRQHFTERIDALQESMEQMRRHFTRRIDDLAKQVGGLATTVGYTLENEAYKALPALLQRDYGLEVVGRLKRGYAVDPEGNEYEVNIFGEALLNGQPLTIIGESKAQLSKQAVDRFIRRKLRPLQRVYPHVFPIIITHMTTSRGVEEYARQQGIAVYYSYDF
ncbi:Chromosome partition protein Smc [bacterium HR15]|nr:Chromosome partition protein Smc [bacterium HR15]